MSRGGGSLRSGLLFISLHGPDQISKFFLALKKRDQALGIMKFEEALNHSLGTKHNQATPDISELESNHTESLDGVLGKKLNLTGIHHHQSMPLLRQGLEFLDEGQGTCPDQASFRIHVVNLGQTQLLPFKVSFSTENFQGKQASPPSKWSKLQEKECETFPCQSLTRRECNRDARCLAPSGIVLWQPWKRLI
jgi:hypothetical protein